MLLFLPYLSLIGYCLFLSKRLKLNIEVTPFFTVSGVIVLLFFAAIVNILSISTTALISIGSGLLCYYSYKIFHEEKNTILKKYLTPGYVIFLLGTAILAVLTAKHHFYAWDTFSHWGSAAKMLAKNHALFPKNEDLYYFNGLSNKSYPPGSALFYYFFYTTAHYSETHSLIAQLILSISPLVLLLQNISWRNTFLAFSIFWISIILATLFGAKIGLFSTLTMDGTLGIFFSCLFLTWLLSDKTPKILLLLTLPASALVLLKPMSYGYILAAGLLITTSLYFERSYSKKSICYLGLFFISPACIELLWQHYLLIQHIAIEWNTRHLLTNMQLNLQYFIPLLQTHLTTIKAILLSAYREKIGWPGLCSPLEWAIIFSLILMINSYFTPLAERKKNIIFHTLFFLGYLSFIVCFILINLFIYNYYLPGLGLTGDFARFSATYFMGWGFFMLLNTMNTYKKYYIEKTKLFLASATILTGFIAGASYAKYRLDKTPDHLNIGIPSLRNTLNKILTPVKTKVPKHKTLFFVWQNNDGFIKIMTAYEILPRKINTGESSYGKKYFKHDLWTTDLTPVSLWHQMTKYNYILLGYTDRQFWKQYGELFPKQPPKLKPIAYYQRCIAPGLFELTGYGQHPKQCHFKNFQAYLFKVKKNKLGELILENIA